MSASDNYLVIAKLDSDDKTMNNLNALGLLMHYPNLKVEWGYSKNKVHAINRNLELTSDIICNHSDDMWFTKKGFDDVIRREMEPDTYLHFPDGFTGDKLCTYSIMHIDYYKRFNYIYNPNYKSLWCDNESMEVAKMLGRYKYVDEQIFEHRHPAWGHGVKDMQLRKTEKFNILDKATYQRRKKINFGL